MFVLNAKLCSIYALILEVFGGFNLVSCTARVWNLPIRLAMHSFNTLISTYGTQALTQVPYHAACYSSSANGCRQRTCKYTFHNDLKLSKHDRNYQCYYHQTNIIRVP